MGSLIQIIFMLLNIVWWIVIIHVIMSWLLNFGILNYNQSFVRQIWTSLERILEPIYRPIRSALPSLGGLDLAPLIVLLGITAIRIIISRNAMYLM
ncbi:YggT family protein [Paroceanicella profunda]|uniref:YggT family protein n=1 Tax=Paroceanicella profunda TaxID=2579971 RepID=A0A5B8FUG2_9RHOB|nr:YggT family protein [Paroceanicella profunda]QDL90844.1 YggT family protein [Paroceanicella profunda]